jgi:transcriptional regulator with GAF, ATPase, and Fis domain
VSTHADVPSEIDRASLRDIGIRSTVVVPLAVDRQLARAVSFDVLRAEREWQPDSVQRLTMLARVFGEVLARKRREEALRTALDELERLKERRQAQGVRLRRDRTRARTDDGGRTQLERPRRARADPPVAPTNATVLLIGETGTGKSCSRRKSTN